VDKQRSVSSLSAYLVLFPLSDLYEEGHEVEEFLYGDVPVTVLVKQVEDLDTRVELCSKQMH
jgi:hypothetical protein